MERYSTTAEFWKSVAIDLIVNTFGIAPDSQLLSELRTAVYINN